ncbi:MAG: hypothetical protein QUV10_17010 [Paracoccaceae bacterium]|nr:hypothetical protein [Paracoccaceae bacterium]
MAFIPNAPTVKPRRKIAKPRMTEAQQAAAMRAAEIGYGKGGKDAVKLDKIEREARAAMAEALADLLSWMEDTNPLGLRDFFVNISVSASASGRNKIAKHPLFPEDLSEAINGHLDAMAAAAVKRAEEAEAEMRADEESASKAKAKRGNAHAAEETA